MKVIPSRGESSKKRGMNPGTSWCEHDVPILTTPINPVTYQTGSKNSDAAVAIVDSQSRKTTEEGEYRRPGPKISLGTASREVKEENKVSGTPRLAKERRRAGYLP